MMDDAEILEQVNRLLFEYDWTPEFGVREFDGALRETILEPVKQKLREEIKAEILADLLLGEEMSVSVKAHNAGLKYAAFIAGGRKLP